MKKYAFMALALGSVAADCSETDTESDPCLDGDTACDTGTDGPTLIMDFTATCEADTSDVFGSKWDYDIDVNGPNSGGLVIVDQVTTDPYHEEHDLTGTTDVDGDGNINLGVHLEGANANPPNQTANVSTLFQCGMDTNMVWRYDVYPASGGNVPDDCVVASGTSVEPSDVWGSDFGGCANGNTW